MSLKWSSRKLPRGISGLSRTPRSEDIQEHRIRTQWAAATFPTVLSHRNDWKNQKQLYV